MDVTPNAAGRETDARLAPQNALANNHGEPPKKRQKRNKPTLSCEECVERKTKVRGLHLLCLLQRLHDDAYAQET
jgi:hypothetical protein